MKRTLMEHKVREHLARFLVAHKRLTLWAVSLEADSYAREHLGRKSDLFQNLGSYANLLPENWMSQWVGDDSGGGILYVVCREHASPSRWTPIAGVFDAAVDFGPGIPPRLPAMA